jgi:transposase
VEQKLAVLRDAFGPEGCVRSACERHEVGSGLIYTWRHQAMSGELAGVRKLAEPAFAEVQISEQLALPAPTVTARSEGVIGIELPSGRVDPSANTGQSNRRAGSSSRVPFEI